MTSDEFASTTSNPHYLDEATGDTWPVTDIRWRSDAGNPLTIEPGPGITPEQVDVSNRSLWRYRAALPVTIETPISLGEGCTPLIASPLHSGGARMKLEWFGPSGSFKDRGAAVMVSFLKSLGVTSILEDSSGNGGSAIATFGAAAGMRVKILAPESTQAAKVIQSRMCGAQVQLVPGPRENCETQAIRQSEQAFYASHNWHPFFIQGTKTLGYELWEDGGFKAPDNIIIPTGAGSNVLGCDLAFRELLNAGQIDRLPRIFCAQPANCAPIHHCFTNGIDTLADVSWSETVAQGTAIKLPVRLGNVLAALHRSGGGTAAVSEVDIIASTHALARVGVYVEPTCASASAAYDQLLSAGTITAAENTVIVLTGTGLKAGDFMLEHANAAG